MKIEIHDVDHGGCAVLTSPSGHRLMLDCGQSLQRPWFPSITYGRQHIDTLMILNLDEDHVEDLPDVWKSCQIGALVSNPTVTASAISAMKAKNGMRAGVEHARDILSAHGAAVIGDWFNDLGGISWHAFYNVYGRDFTDTNNLSLAVFVTFGGFTILFGGDMEAAGWRRLMEIPAFRRRLFDVKVYVASHHGRDNGRCDELFDYCKPELVIFSDGPKQYETQETLSWYRTRAIGIPDWSKPAGLQGYPTRKVMTTRTDGTLTIQVEPSGKYMVYPDRDSSAEFADIAALNALLKPQPSWLSALSSVPAPSPNALTGMAGLAALSQQSPLVAALARNWGA